MICLLTIMHALVVLSSAASMAFGRVGTYEGVAFCLVSAAVITFLHWPCKTKKQRRTTKHITFAL